MYKKIETIFDSITSQTLIPYVDELYMHLSIHNKVEHQSTNIHFKNIKGFKSFYKQYEIDAKNNKILASGYVIMYTIYPDVFKKKDNSEIIERMSREEMIKYIKNGNTHLMSERLDGFTLFQNMDFMNHKYMAYPSILVSDEDKPKEAIRKNYTSYHTNNAYYKKISTKDDLDNILAYNEKIINDALKFNTTYLYNIVIGVINVTPNLNTIGWMVFNLA
jgi:hypothetical protein